MLKVLAACNVTTGNSKSLSQKKQVPFGGGVSVRSDVFLAENTCFSVGGQLMFMFKQPFQLGRTILQTAGLPFCKFYFQNYLALQKNVYSSRAEQFCQLH